MDLATRSEKVEETKTRLVAAARQAFATQGYAAASMDDLTAEAGLTRGALYHNFGDKKGLLQAVIDQIDAEMLVRMRAAGEGLPPWEAFVAEGVAYIEMSLEPEIQRIMLLDGPAVLGDPSRWPNQTACLRTTAQMIQTLIDDEIVKPMNAEAAAHLVNGAALNAALWVAAADEPERVFESAVYAFRHLVGGLLRSDRLGDA